MLFRTELDDKQIPIGGNNSVNKGFLSLYFGRRGHGKTQQAVIDAYEAYKRWKIIISNTWLDFPHIRFKKAKDLIPILKEIAEYANDVKMPIEAPSAMLKDYWLKRSRKAKSYRVQEFFLLFDEVGKHLNTRNWQKNFKDEYLRDMLTEPRKYWLQIVMITQSWKRVDVEVREACEDWFLFSRKGIWILEQQHITHFWVLNGEFDIWNPYIIERKRRWLRFWKILKQYRQLYWTGEVIGDGLRDGFVPHTFEEWMIYKRKEKKERKVVEFEELDSEPLSLLSPPKGEIDEVDPKGTSESEVL